MRNKVEQRFIEGPHRRLSYYLGGAGDSEKVLLFLNGLYHGQEAWIKQQRHPYFSKNHRLLFIDYRGVGESIMKQKKTEGPVLEFGFDDIVEDIHAILAHEGIEKVILVGYSVGGMMALWFAYRFKACVDTMILLNASITVDFRIQKMMEGMVALLDEGCSLNNVFSVVYPWNHSRGYFEKLADLDETIRRKYSEYNQDILSFKLLLKAIADRPDLSVAMEDFSVPTLLVSADEDMIFPLVRQKELVSRIKNCVHYVVKGGGHASFIEQYEEVNHVMERYLKGEEIRNG